MLRAYCSGWDGGETPPDLDKEEIHHLARVRRVRSGEQVEILNGRGAVALCRVEAATGKSVEFTVIERNHHEPPALRRHLLVAVPKGKTLPALLHKAVELGVSEITLLLTKNSEVGKDRAEQKKDRLDAVVVEALKQSGNPWMPVLRTAVPLAEALDSPGGDSVQRLCAALHPEARPLWEVLQETLQPKGTVEVYVGPEGDFTADEYGLLAEAGCRFISLGPLVLKVETAASLVMGILGIWSPSRDS
ncbi:MAG: 16S rRNA (uracil(1498)-N(3))-methyltransferase [Puniceicoccaceae bacterium]